MNWLYPGMRFKRWSFLSFLGAFFIALALFFILGFWFPGIIPAYLSPLLNGEEMPQLNLVLLLFGIILFTWGSFFFFLGMKNAVFSLVRTLFPRQRGELMEDFNRQFALRRGPQLVVIGGGTGLSNMLRGLKEYSSNITAIVTVADDGGSSGRLRTEMGVLPPGDIRNVLVSMAEAEPMMKRLFQYRFPPGNDLEGHSFGNLFITTMWDLMGDFEKAVQESSRILAVRGQVFPSSLFHIDLCAELEDGSVVKGESHIPTQGKAIKRVFLEPENATILHEAQEAIQEADAIILGPGSLYTSIIPNLLLKGTVAAIASSQALKIYVCNVMTQPGETDSYTASRHLKAVEKHSQKGLIDVILVNDGPIPLFLAEKYQQEGAYPVQLDLDVLNEMGVLVLNADMVSHKDYVHHNPYTLARIIMECVSRQGSREGSVLEQLFPVKGFSSF